MPTNMLSFTKGRPIAQVIDKNDKIKLYKELKKHPDIRDSIAEYRSDMVIEALTILKHSSNKSINDLDGKQCDKVLELLKEITNENRKIN